MDSAKELRELWLGSNRIDTLQGFPTCGCPPAIPIPWGRSHPPESSRGAKPSLRSACQGLNMLTCDACACLSPTASWGRSLLNLTIVALPSNRLTSMRGLEVRIRLTDAAPLSRCTPLSPTHFVSASRSHALKNLYSMTLMSLTECFPICRADFALHTRAARGSRRFT